MEVNKILSIIIPTYNRADFLDYCLAVHIPLAKEYNIQIFVCDNASTDTTPEVMDKWMREYPLLKYHRNECNVGPDKNFEIGLRLPDTEYVWLLGDTYQIPEKGIEYILGVIEKNGNIYEGFVFNLMDKLKTSTCHYTDANQLLSDLGALMTCLSCLVFSRQLLYEANFRKYQNTYFMQTGIIFEYIAKKSFQVYWVQSESIKCINTLKLQKTSWVHTSAVFEIGCNKWANFILSLPSIYTKESKMKCIMDFGKVSGIFIWKNILILRIKNILNIKTFLEYKDLFTLTIDYPKSYIFFLSIMPRQILIFFYRIFKIYQKYQLNHRRKYGS